jgi:hypothetical protein
MKTCDIASLKRRLKEAFSDMAALLVRTLELELGRASAPARKSARPLHRNGATRDPARGVGSGTVRQRAVRAAPPGRASFSRSRSRHLARRRSRRISLAPGIAPDHSRYQRGQRAQTGARHAADQLALTSTIAAELAFASESNERKRSAHPRFIMHERRCSRS